MLHRLHQNSGYSRDPRFGSAYDHSTSFVLWIECDRYHAQSPSDPIVIIPCAFLRSENGRKWIFAGKWQKMDFRAFYVIPLLLLIMSTLLNMTLWSLNRTVIEVMVGFRYVYGLIHSNMPFAGEPWMSMEQCWVKEVRPYMPYLFIPRGQVV